MSVFGHFTFFHISLPNEQIFTFQMSCGQLADLPKKKQTLGYITFLHISHPNGQIFTFQESCGQLVVVSIILKDFSESRKK